MYHGKPSAFTCNYQQRAQEIITEVAVATIETDSSHNAKKVSSLAVWDTGATSTVITNHIVKKLDLQPVNVITVFHGGGKTESPQYLVDIYIPNKVTVPSLLVVEGHTGTGDINVLIGMDIISIGDFAITNSDDNTTFSFRIPSIATIDFVLKQE